MSDIDSKLNLIIRKIDDMESCINLRQNFILDRLSRISERITSNSYKLLLLQRRIMFNGYDYAASEDCSICYQKKDLENRIITPCNHVFHQKCLESWTAIKKNCPYCRHCLQ